MFKIILATIAIAASQLSMASACGWKHEACCNIQYNNPNIGICHDPRSVCWEGICMDCGTNGKIACPTEPRCEHGFLENADGWCYTAPGQAPATDFSCHGGCPHHTVCFWGRCEACGNNGQPQCGDGKGCGHELIVNADGFCATAPHCGWVNEACCAGNQCFDHGSVCKHGQCVLHH